MTLLSSLLNNNNGGGLTTSALPLGALTELLLQGFANPDGSIASTNMVKYANGETYVRGGTVSLNTIYDNGSVATPVLPPNTQLSLATVNGIGLGGTHIASAYNKDTGTFIRIPIISSSVNNSFPVANVYVNGSINPIVRPMTGGVALGPSSQQGYLLCDAGIWVFAPKTGSTHYYFSTDDGMTWVAAPYTTGAAYITIIGILLFDGKLYFSNSSTVNAFVRDATSTAPSTDTAPTLMSKSCVAGDAAYVVSSSNIVNVIKRGTSNFVAISPSTTYITNIFSRIAPTITYESNINRYIAQSYSGSSHVIMISTDGLTWTQLNGTYSSSAVSEPLLPHPIAKFNSNGVGYIVASASSTTITTVAFNKSYTIFDAETSGTIVGSTITNTNTVTITKAPASNACDVISVSPTDEYIFLSAGGVVPGQYTGLLYGRVYENASMPALVTTAVYPTLTTTNSAGTSAYFTRVK